MTDIPDDTPSDDIAQVFEALRGEVSLMRRAVEGLTAARDRVPDYSVTLGGMSEALKANAAGIARIEASPAVRLSPSALALELVKASAEVRASDARKLDEVRLAMAQTIGRLDGIVTRGQSADCQTRKLIWACAGSFLAGVLLWSFIPGVIARSLPESWHVPEWMAARTMGMKTDELAKDSSLFRKTASETPSENRSESCLSALRPNCGYSAIMAMPLKASVRSGEFEPRHCGFRAVRRIAQPQCAPVTLRVSAALALPVIVCPTR